MKSETTLSRRLWNPILVALAMLAFGPGLAAADYTVSAGEPVVISDDVFDRTTTVISLAGQDPSSVNRSGLGDDTNPNQGNTSNAPTTGNNNPNNANN